MLLPIISMIGDGFGQAAQQLKLLPTEAGTMEVSLEGKPDHYYLLYRSLDLEDLGEVAAMALGTNGAVNLRDRFAAQAPQVFYRVREMPYKDSVDVDNDGRSDVNELRESLFSPGLSNENPFNPFEKLRGDLGSNLLTAAQFEDYSIISSETITLGITGERFLKFVSFPLHDPGPAILFMNTRVHQSHGSFLSELAEKTGYTTSAVWHGELAWLPGPVLNGPGLYTFNLQRGDVPRFDDIRILYGLLTKNVPFVDGNLAFRPWHTSLVNYVGSAELREQLKEEGIPVWVDPAFDDGVDATKYAALNEGETYGLLRIFEDDERPSLLDVAIFRHVPNDVPLLRGIITESPQTPLSHVNLRALQNGNPNAYIAKASSDPRIAPLIGRYVRFAVHRDHFEIEEVSQAEVEAHLDKLRPIEDQRPRRDLAGNRKIQSLEDLDFRDAPSIGAKAANLAELISLGRAGLVPRRLFPPFARAVPFHFYDEFMKFNDFYTAAADMMAEEGFADDPTMREEALKDFRKRVRKGNMPQWMLDELAVVQAEFSEVGGIRCRSSTNNEDLPGFNGAGLYESYTHYPDEGHLSKSIKQVFASLWTFIAFEHREFYRIDHFQAAMGVLMHPNYQNEKANGVAVSRYDLVETATHPFYANAQVGEDLVTNPEISSRPEELLLPRSEFSRSFSGPLPLRLVSSNQVPLGEQVLSDAKAVLLGSYLDIIATHFERLYPPNPDFAVEIEFKVTEADQLIIKQVRPWVH